MTFNPLDFIGTLGGGILAYLVPFIVVLTIVVFFHELGHFLIARWCGVRVLVFSIGFGPELLGFTDRHGTRWKLAAIPLGGYVKFFGDDNAASVPDTAAVATMSPQERRRSFFHQSVGRRSAVVVAGPIANFILAVVIFAGIFMSYGRPNTSARVDQVQPDGVAAAAGFQPGDLVVAINGDEIANFLEMQRIVAVSANQKLVFTIERGDRRVEIEAAPALKEVTDNLGNVHRQGVLGIVRQNTGEQPVLEKSTPLQAIYLGARESWFIVEQTMSYLGRLVMGRDSANQLGGPARIAEMAGQIWKGGLNSGGWQSALIGLLSFTAALSVSIGLLNLFPVPLLDGGHLMFYAIEAIRGRPLSDRAQEVGFRIGLALVLMLMIFATFNDMLHFKVL